MSFTTIGKPTPRATSPTAKPEKGTAVMSTKIARAARAQAKTDASTCDAYARMQNILAKERDYQPITYEEAAALTDEFVNFEWSDEQIFALIKLLHGICAAHYSELWDKDAKVSVESLVMDAANQAYRYSFHFNYSFSEFFTLDAENERDRGVLRREYLSALTSEAEQ
jgi:hypothetical protein